jgi:hypothetical protein
MRPNRRRLPIPQFEFAFGADYFRLVQETGLDGERLAQDHQQAEEARKLAEAAQAKLLPRRTPKRTHVWRDSQGFQPRLEPPFFGRGQRGPRTSRQRAMPCYGEKCQARRKILFFINCFFSFFVFVLFFFLPLFVGSSSLMEHRSRDLA